MKQQQKHIKYTKQYNIKHNNQTIEDIIGGTKMTIRKTYIFDIFGVYIYIHICVCEYNMKIVEYTLHAVRWGQNFPNPNGGVILRSKLTTSRCFIRPLLEVFFLKKNSRRKNYLILGLRIIF
jgi:hypothetical protein